ncbi:2-oxoglutarate and iron-dependent oxygenase domain-containing protein 2 isoform X2 [Numida meleagris]|uniref:2-oxoglutarate and iron-dependent oxygenase domain-containing protein 2 isoform X2 n=1 Tax=Numida meleagris TaxID=8996 RepID=UPI000B3DA947|nr:2-oxoglutarate and iron-dependent oxygenase domain-containing protein 2 isoform X2 [Numida meleagris]
MSSNLLLGTHGSAATTTSSSATCSEDSMAAVGARAGRAPDTPLPPRARPRTEGGGAATRRRDRLQRAAPSVRAWKRGQRLAVAVRALRERGCGSEEQMAAVLREIEAEVQRRKQLVHQSAERKAIISQCYKRKHSEVYTLQDSFLAPDFLDMVRYCISPDANLHGLLRYTESFSDKRIYRLPVFTEEFCQAFIEELENFEQSDMPRGRPNSMNNYGVLLNELGMDENFITPLREKYLRPITALLYPDLGGACLDSHKAFVVKYSLHEDLDLSSHYDNAEVTLNVSLGKDFTEGNLYFGDFRQDPSPVPNYIEVEHVRTQGLLHRGGQIHGALPIASGERWNLIIWMRSSAIRNQLCPMCNQKPQLVEAEGFGDGFTETCQEDVPETVDLCSVW